MIIRNLKTMEYSITDFTRRGWMNTTRDSQKVDSVIYTAADKSEKPEKGESFAAKGGKPHSIIKGKWSDKLVVQQCDSKTEELVWQKSPYPENYTWMYGMTDFNLQLNSFPEHLKGKVAPTDTRRRPD